MPDEIRVTGDVAEVPIGEGQYALIDAADVLRVRGFVWKLNSKGEPYTTYPDPDHPTVNTSATLKMIIMGVRAKGGQAIKNLDGNQLNCRRANVKLMSLAEARALDRKNYGPQIRAPKVVKKSIRKILGMQGPSRPEPAFKRRVLDGPTVLVQASVPVSLQERLKAACKEDKRAISDVVSESVSEWLERRAPSASRS